MDLNMLYVLEQLITQGSFKQVAEQCFTSTSTLTRQMNSFEAELGFTLLENGEANDWTRYNTLISFSDGLAVYVIHSDYPEGPSEEI